MQVFEILKQFDEIEHAVVDEYEVSYEQFARANQVHNDTISVVHKCEMVEQCDGLITVHKGVPLAIRHADCQAALFYDPIAQVIANVHCGWRGQVKNIYQKCVGKMCTECGSQPEDIVVGIGPSLGPQHAQFVHYRQEFPQAWWHYRKEGDLFNLWEIAKWQLVEAGVQETNIEISGICTYSEGWHSYRRDQTKRRHLTLIAMK